MKKLYENKEPRLPKVEIPDRPQYITTYEHQPSTVNPESLDKFDNYFVRCYDWITKLFKKKGIEDEIR